MHTTNRELSIAELTQAVGLLVRRVRAAAASQELSLAESSVLSRLDTDGPATTADLARAESVKPQSMGATIAALEAQGLVARTPHPTDKRQMHIVLTPTGASVRAATRAAKRSWLAQAIAQLPEHEQDLLFQAGDIMKRLAETDPGKL